jgi:putative transposase
VSVKQRAYPEPGHQSEMLVTHCNHARFCFNIGLDQRKMNTRGDRARGNRVTAASQQRELTEARREFDWLRAGSTVVQQGALRDLDRAFANFFAGTAKFPTFRRKAARQSFVVRDVRLRRYNRHWAAVLVPKAGWLRFRLSVNWAELSDASSARVSFHRGRWHVSFTTPPRKKRVSGDRIVGVDRGVAVTVMTSDGERFRAPSLTPGEQQRFRSLEQLLSTQTKGSRRRQVTKDKLATLRETLDRRRTDWIEQTTAHLAATCAAVVIEDLRITDMVSRVPARPDGAGGFLPNGQAAKTGLNRAIHTSVWGGFARRLADKADMVKVNPAYTSQRCNSCGHTCRENRDSQAIFSCVQCGHTANADLNAACNIRDAGIAKLAAESPQKPGGTGCSGEAVIGDANLQPV